MTHFVTKAMPISNIDSECHNYKKLKSNIGLDYSGFISRKWFLIAWHIHKHRYQLPGQKQFEARCMLTEERFWFLKCDSATIIV